MLQSYIEQRRRGGEQVTKKSPLISSMLEKGEFIDPEGYGEVWRRTLERAGLDQKANRWYVYHIHTLRKYFRSNCVGVDPSYREHWMRHKGGYLDISYFRAEEPLHLAEYRKTVPYLSIYRHGEDESWKMVIRALARAQGRLGDDKLKRLEEILARSADMDEAIDKFRRLGENPKPKPKENNIKIVKGEEALVDHLKQGWTLVKELNHDKYLLKSG